jgi:hypothetical protein
MFGLILNARRRLATFLLFLAAPGLVAALAWASEGRTLHRDFEPGEHSDLRLEVPYGELTVTAADVDQVQVEVVARCRHGWDDCTDRLERIDVESRSRGEELVLEVTGVRKMSNHGLELEVHATVPAGLALAVHMGAGEVRIEDVKTDLRVHLGAGDIDIRMPEEKVRSVDLRAGVGDASLMLPNGRVEAERAHLIGGRLHWRRGPGDAEVEVEVGAGDIDVRLK